MITQTSAPAEWNPVPADIRDYDLAIIAWCDCLMWAVTFHAILDDFAADTGTPLNLGSTGINALIDKATGFQDAEIRRFIEWFNVNVWGRWAE